MQSSIISYGLEEESKNLVYISGFFAVLEISQKGEDWSVFV